MSEKLRGNLFWAAYGMLLGISFCQEYLWLFAAASLLGALADFRRAALETPHV